MTQYTTHKVILDETDNAEVRDALWQEIKAYNKTSFGKRTDQAFSLTIRDENSKIIAGLNGIIFWIMHG